MTSRSILCLRNLSDREKSGSKKNMGGPGKTNELLCIIFRNSVGTNLPGLELIQVELSRQMIQQQLTGLCRRIPEISFIDLNIRRVDTEMVKNTILTDRQTDRQTA